MSKESQTTLPKTFKERSAEAISGIKKDFQKVSYDSSPREALSDAIMFVELFADYNSVDAMSVFGKIETKKEENEEYWNVFKKITSCLPNTCTCSNNKFSKEMKAFAIQLRGLAVELYPEHAKEILDGTLKAAKK